jgi:hypothetical protein
VENIKVTVFRDIIIIIIIITILFDGQYHVSEELGDFICCHEKERFSKMSTKQHLLTYLLHGAESFLRS